VTDRVLPSDFIVHGVVCPPRICRMVASLLVSSLEEALNAQRSLDPELVLWIRAVDLEGRRWAANADVSESDAPDDESSQSTNHEQLTAADVAKELGCQQANVRFHVRKGHLTPARRDPYLFDRAEVNRFLELRRKSA
jgi:MerR HTH family regulatory protein